MFSFIARAIAAFFLAIAIVAAVIDITSSIAASEWVITPLGASWAKLSLTSIQATQGAIQGYIHPLLWDPVIQTILGWPTWLIFSILALLFYALGRKRRITGRRFSRR
ncbi:MAG: hypothetical protein AAF468_10460 [Pseudomonadota bacterium]